MQDRIFACDFVIERDITFIFIWSFMDNIIWMYLRFQVTTNRYVILTVNRDFLSRVVNNAFPWCSAINIHKSFHTKRGKGVCDFATYEHKAYATEAWHRWPKSSKLLDFIYKFSFSSPKSKKKCFAKICSVSNNAPL